MPVDWSLPLSRKVLCVIMGGGQGSRLFPLTKERAKPAVPLAGKYRLVDIPISNCINSGFRRICLLTQFNSASLHRHISQSYKFDQFTGGFVEILPAQQTCLDTTWYEGTADAVRKNIGHFLNHGFDYLVILSGDQLYRMDLRIMLDQHRESGSDVTVATLPVGLYQAPSLGIMQINDEKRIVRFAEKPQDPEVIEGLRIPQSSHESLGIHGNDPVCLASMGIYIFSREMAIDLSHNHLVDFGKHVIPSLIDSRRVSAFVFQGYWEDIGSIRSYFEANLDLVSELPRFNFFDMTAPIFSRPRFLPGSKINGATIDHAVISDGCIINPSIIRNSIIGFRTVLGSGTELNRVVALGYDHYESMRSIAEHEEKGQPRLGIGTGCHIQEAIIDKNARIGNNVVISPEGKPDHLDHELYYIRDGIVVIPRDAVIPHGMVI